jgi:peptidoglycan/LPS O-acetylase OafA/YrhL
MLMAFVLSTLLAGPVPRFDAAFKEAWSRPPSVDDVVAIVFLTRDHFETINAPAWSLIEEMRLSLVFPVIALLARRMPGRIPLYGVVLVSLAGQLGHMWVTDLESSIHTHLETLRYSALFLLGATLAVRRGAMGRLWAGRLGPVSLVVLGLGLFLYAAPQRLIPNFLANDVLIGAGAALLLIIALFEPRARDVLESRIPQWLGRVSYSLYLSHMVVLLTAIHALGMLTQPWVALLLVLVASLAGAAVLHRLIEVPSQRLGRFLTTHDALRRQPFGALTPRSLTR